jgi:hypothetical protein
MLRDFLAYAESQAAVLPAPVSGEGEGATSDVPAVSASSSASMPAERAPEPVRAEFARRLREAGLVVHEAFGGSAHPIDLAVEDPRRPGHVLVAVESDGPTYAAMRSTRDRDRLRVEQLGRLGWQHVRVWSTDLFRDPARDVARVVALTQRASASARTRPASPQGDVQDTGVVVENDEQVPAPTEGEQPETPAAVDATGAEDDALFPAPAPAPETATPEAPAEEDGRKRRVLRRKPKRAPEQTRDDTDAGWGELFDASAHDRWLQEQRPPHWGRD